ncbi:MAG: PAS domain-containing sensor histidine kinase [Methylophaga sp.]|uniref:sensor histidine kinase n=1 Tax=unclassified Methylophaga TaxID=2629249 RepID=UPI000C5E7CF7|nr:ATP-binding protein [Methylophaga sp. UBA678]MAX52885.1 PAS domain-containing sensor histidine kinase [Methylophaga sp.]|tara:strand:+ start:43689 stop:44879 length:1191 start_codon:yes stop_codon:yes gene_type:complete
MNLKLSLGDDFQQSNYQSQPFSRDIDLSTISNVSHISAEHIQQSTNTDADQLANRHSRLLAVLPAGVVVIDGSGFIQEANEAAISLLGEPLSGERWVNVIERAFDPKPSDGHDVSLKDGRLVHISTNPLGHEPGQIILLQDVTDTRALQSKVSHLQRLSTIGEVTARLAHQIRTPLSSAMLYLSPLLKEGADEQVKQRFATRVKDSLTHMEQLIRDLLSFSRGNMASPSPVAVSDLLSELEQQFSAQNDVENSTVTMTLVNQVNDDYIYGSQSALISAITNLLNNARQACEGHGQIEVMAEYAENNAKEQCIQISVNDNGEGMSEAELNKVLTPFYTTRSNGTGLGLAVVQSIVKAHRGLLAIESEPKKGSSVKLLFPIYTSANTSPEQAAEEVAL